MQRETRTNALSQIVDESFREDYSDDTSRESIESKVNERGINIDDPLGLLQSSKHVAAAATDAMLATHSRKRKYKTAEEKLEANRKSAAESRHRKKMLLMHLQEKVNTLRQENSLLRSENKDLRNVFVLLHSQKMPFHNANVEGSNLLNTLGSSMTQLAMTRNALSQNPLTRHLHASNQQKLSLNKHQLGQENHMRLHTQVCVIIFSLSFLSNLHTFLIYCIVPLFLIVSESYERADCMPSRFWDRWRCSSTHANRNASI